MLLYWRRCLCFLSTKTWYYKWESEILFPIIIKGRDLLLEGFFWKLDFAERHVMLVWKRHGPTKWDFWTIQIWNLILRFHGWRDNIKTRKWNERRYAHWGLGMLAMCLGIFKPVGLLPLLTFSQTLPTLILPFCRILYLIYLEYA